MSSNIKNWIKVLPLEGEIYDLSSSLKLGGQPELGHKFLIFVNFVKLNPISVESKNLQYPIQGVASATNNEASYPQTLSYGRTGDSPSSSVVDQASASLTIASGTPSAARSIRRCKN